MKTTKIFTLAIALIMVFTLAACGSGSNNSGGSTNTPPSETPSAPDTSTPLPNPTQGNGNDPADYGTIPMPDGFPENPGDAEFFNPVTDDYVLARGGNLISLVSYNEQGDAVQFVSKSVGTADRMPFLESTRNAHGTEKGIEVVGNVMYYDWLQIYDDGGYGLTEDAEPVASLDEWYRKCSMFPTKTGPLWDRGPQSGGVIDLREERFGGAYYSKP